MGLAGATPTTPTPHPTAHRPAKLRPRRIFTASPADYCIYGIRFSRHLGGIGRIGLYLSQVPFSGRLSAMGAGGWWQRVRVVPRGQSREAGPVTGGSIPHLGRLWKWVHNPGHADHRFRWMPSTRSGPCRPPVPTASVHVFLDARIGGRLSFESVDGVLRNSRTISSEYAFHRDALLTKTSSVEKLAYLPVLTPPVLWASRQARASRGRQASKASSGVTLLLPVA